ncbi:MAG TPA: PKD domain-containing protein [Bacteroidia bacterium]|nr:PKD domain-containing protein [Bacteroidia bacterium]
MRKLNFLLLVSVFILLISNLASSQNQVSFKNGSKLISTDKLKQSCKFFKGDSLAGFDLDAIIREALPKQNMYSELVHYIYLREISFVKKKYNISKMPGEINASAYRTHISPVLAGVCNNLDFENGNFAGWTGGIGYNPNTNAPLVITSPAITTLGANSAETSCSFHTLVNGGVDPYGGFPMVDPGGGTWACRLGGELLNIGCDEYNSSSFIYPYLGPPYPPNITTCTSNDPNSSSLTSFQPCSNGESIQQTFPVTAANCLFSYNYAVVMADAPHHGDSCNYFRVQVYNQSGTLIPCLSYFVETDTTGSGIVPPGFLASGQVDKLGNSVLYVPWTKNTLNLQPYIGQNITVKFTAAGCYLGGHFCYAYIDCSCGPLQLVVPSGPVCAGLTQTITGPPNGYGGTYSWSGPGIVSGATTQTITANQSGTYSLTVTNQMGCTYTIDTTISFFPVPTITANSATICPSNTVTLNATSSGGAGALTYTWSPPGGLSVTNDSTTIATVNSSTAYTVTASSVHNCTATAVSNITVPVAPPPTFSAPPVCLGNPTVINNTTGGGGSFSWNFGDGSAVVVNQISPTHTYTLSGTFVVSSTVNAGGCVATSTVNVTVNPNPTVTVTNSTMCGGSGPVTVTASGASTYTWNTGATGANLTVNPAVTTTYTVTGATASGCTVSATTTVTVVTNPTITVSPTSICVGSTGTLTVSGATTYTWTGSSIVGATTGSLVTANPGATSTYTVIGTIGTCTATTTGVLTVNPLPVPAFTSSPVCFGTPTSFTNTSTPAGSTYNWSFGDGNTSTSASPANTYSAAGTYAVTLTVTTTNGCVATVTNNTTVKPVPVLNPVANVGVCDQAQMVVQPFVSVPAGATVGWTNNNTAIGLGANGAGNITPFTATSGGSPVSIQGVVTAVPTLNGCVGPAVTFTLTVAPQPSVTLTSPPLTCPGQNVPAPTYTMNPNDPAMTFNWVNSNTAVGLGANGTGIPPSFTASSNSTLANITSVVTVTPTLNGCVGPPGTYTLAIYPTPVINPVANVEKCPNVNIAAINFSVLPGGGNPSFGWSNSNPSIGLTNGGVGSPLPAFTSVNAGTTSQTGTITVSASLNGCPAIPIPFTITVDPNPVAAFSASHLICVGSPMSFTDHSGVGSGFIAQWAWNLDAVVAPFSNAQNPQYIIQPAGTHSITETVTSDKGCVATVTEPVYINYIPVANYTGGGQGCPVLTVTNFADASSVTAPAHINSWSWNFGNTATSNSQTPGTVTYGNSSAVQNAVYAVSLVVSTDSGCVSTAHSSPCVTVYPHPLPGFSWGPQDPEPDIMNPTVYFFDQSQGASGQNGLTWYLGDVFLQNQANNYTGVQNPVHTYEYSDPYVYYVTQWVQNSYGCKDSITKPVEIKPNWTFYIPNAFSPNGDGVNEGFKGTGIGIDNTTYNLWVFDRWGNMIFYTGDMEKVWDGRVQGKNGDIVQEDVYVWKVKFQDFTGKKHEYKGTVSVVK